MPVAISFTVETDGNLPTGQSLGEAISAVDQATDGYPAYYMVNCAHPTHFDNKLDSAAPWAGRLRGVRANASSKSHAELNESTELDFGNPAEFGRQYLGLKKRLPGLNIMGGCCGTDTRHVNQVALTCAPMFGKSR
jgi:homocysteine S-methyltransferase